MLFSKKPFGDVKPFDSFKEPYKVLVFTGIYKIQNPDCTLKLLCHNLFRYFALLMVTVYLTQHWIYIYQKFEARSFDKLIEGIALTTPNLVFLFKAMALSVHHGRLEKVQKLMEGPYFAARSSKDQSLLYEQFCTMFKFFRIIHLTNLIAVVFWITNPFLKKFRDDDNILVTVFPFQNDTVFMFTISVLWDTVAFYPWLAVSHLSIDYLIANYLSSARLQIKIIKNHLLTVFDQYDSYNGKLSNYRDIFSNDPNQESFLQIIKRYDKIVWYLQEIYSIFNFPISAQLLVASGEICVVVYKLSTFDSLSTQHVFYFVILILLQGQVVLYCYFGELVTYESQSINTAVYNSKWLSLPPQLRKQLLIAMARWHRPLIPKVAFIVPLTLSTNLTVIKTAYSIYSIMITKS